TTFDEAQPQSQLPEQQEQLTRRRSSAASSCISVQLQQPQLDQDLAEKLARRLQLSDAGSEDAAAVGAVAADSEAGAQCEHQPRMPSTDMLSERRERQRLLLARWRPLPVPSAGSQTCHQAGEVRVTDSDVSETSFSFIAASPQQQKRNPPPPASSTPPPAPPPPSNPSAGFPEEAFVMYDADGDNFIGFNDLKLMMEKLGAPQTHLGLKSMIKEVDEDHDSRINFREFLAIFRKARAGQLDYSGELMAWYDCYVEVSEINVEEVGVMEAKNFFESKIAIQSADGKLQAELREQRLRRQAEEEGEQRSRDSFRNTRAMFT
uniref:Calmodulin n=1 Tax=Macrostomum lignano TaxID=282301 RepID=A0A1I8F8B0_9PLAT